MNLPHLTCDQRTRIACIEETYRRLTGRPLVAACDDLVGTLWSAPFAIVAHGIEVDPIFFFGNRVALDLFEMNFASFTRLPSRFSAEPVLRQDRARLLDRVTRDGLIEDYAGVRVSATGKRFHIANASVWNVTDADGRLVGQAAAFADWVHIAKEGTEDE